MATSLLPRLGAAPALLVLVLFPTAAAAQGAPAPAPAKAPAAAPAPAAAAAPAAAPAAPTASASPHADADGDDDAGDDAADLPAKGAAPAKGDAAVEELAPPPKAELDWQNPPTKRRGGFTVGIAGGLALGTAAGYPNEIQKIGFERYYTETGVGVGTGGFIWLGGALTDWFTFGLGLGGANFGAKDHTVSTGGFIFHLEAFPLIALGERWRDLGVNLDTGTSSSYTTADATGDQKVIDGALPAKIGGGVFWEGIRFWKVSTGPWLYADYVWSSTVRQGGVYLGWRTALYTKP